MRRTTERRYAGWGKDFSEEEDSETEGLMAGCGITSDVFVTDDNGKTLADGFRGNNTGEGLQISFLSQAVVKSVHFPW